jgi:3-oxoacyl-ACP reductase-like protein
MEETAAIRTSGIPVSVSSTTSADGDASADPTASAAAAAATVGDDEHDSKEVVLRRYFIQEWEIVSDILRRIVDAGGVAEPADVQRIRSIVCSLCQPPSL